MRSLGGGWVLRWSGCFGGDQAGYKKRRKSGRVGDEMRERAEARPRGSEVRATASRSARNSRVRESQRPRRALAGAARMSQKRAYQGMRMMPKRERGRDKIASQIAVFDSIATR